MADPEVERRGWKRVLLGTAPGLERFLMASVPAIVLGSIAYFTLGRWPGLAIGIGVLAVGMAIARGMTR